MTSCFALAALTWTRREIQVDFTGRRILSGLSSRLRATVFGQESLELFLNLDEIQEVPKVPGC